jgi:hypothetical protein
MKIARKVVKAGKRERIRALLNNLGATQPQPMVREQPWLAEVLEHHRLSRFSTVKESTFAGHPEADFQ